MTAAGDASVPGNATVFRPRNYQLEMLEASMKENIIVAMDTGSGKTHIAILRIIAELERCPPDKLVWFLAPTIDLCIQQHKVVLSNIPGVRSRTLTGLDMVDLWTDQTIWDAVLQDVRLVISTHSVLADALGHGFVKISRLALMVFDEAHHCRKNHPANKILRSFYHPALSTEGRDAVPHILGLSASPIVKSQPQELAVIESNLNSVCRTPREHRTELLRHTNCPKLIPLKFSLSQASGLECQSLVLKLLVKCWRTLDLEDDPYPKQFREEPLTDEKQLEAVIKGQTYCNQQLRKFVARSVHIYDELGPWATDFFIRASIEQFKASATNCSMMLDWDDDEKVYLVGLLSQIPLPDIQHDLTANDYFLISPKLAVLIDFLDRMYDPESSGLIFVKQRITVSTMTYILSVHPLTKERYRCASYVGWSSNNNRKEYLGDLNDLETQRDTLEQFRSGRKNLIVSTDVLEEGIDINACSMVICYDKPPSLKSFVQRRGRARQKRSCYAIMLPEKDELASLDRWRNLEDVMLGAYQDDEGQRGQELYFEDDEEEVPATLLVKSTGARLTPDTAMAHLHHFCAVLPSEPYVDNRPVFSIDDDEEGSRRRTVILPSSVHPEVRSVRGKRGWRTKRAAMKDAAFEAYKALYEFGLVNDNLLPLASKPELKFGELPELPSLIEVSEQYDPWVELAHSWSSPDTHRQQISVRQNGVLVDVLPMALTVPAIVPTLEPLTLFWDQRTTFTLLFDPARPVPLATPESIQQMRVITATFLQAVSPRLADTPDDFVALFGPDIPEAELGRWINANKGHEPALDVYPLRSGFHAIEMGIVRDCTDYNKPLIFKRWLVSEADSPSPVVDLECDPLPRRRNLLSRQIFSEGPDQEASNVASNIASKVRIIPAATCTIDSLPFAQSIFGLFISAIVERLAATLIAAKLCKAVLKDVGFSSIRHVITAITTPSAQAGTNYQRFSLSIQIGMKDIFQSVGQRTSKTLALRELPLTQALTPTSFPSCSPLGKWSAPLISERIQATAAKREMSTKTLADVVEALVGAAYMDGGMPVAQACIKRLLPNIDLQNLDTQSTLPGSNPSGHLLNRKLPQHIGYNFNNEALLKEALTHPSCDYDPHTQSYQRLEFLGDAVLEILVVTALSEHPVEISQGAMTMIKAAAVNANLLAFFCLEFSLAEQKIDVQVIQGDKPTLISSEEHHKLWHFMRYHDQALKSNRDATVERHRLLRSGITDSVLHSTSYPWESLSRVNAEKFFSDLIESIIGAIFVDSNGDLAACEAFAERIGLLAYLRRILNDGVDVLHPRNQAQRLAKSDRLSFAVEQRKLDRDDLVDSPPGTGRRAARYSCSAFLNDVQVVVVGDCLSREEAEVNAANAVVGLLRERS